MHDLVKVSRRVFLLSIVAASVAASPQNYGATESPGVGAEPEWVIAIHGGAGGTEPEDVSTEKAAQTRRDLHAALAAAAAILESGGTGPEAVEAAIRVMEDSPHFNAGRGAVLDEHGVARHDASIMRGEDYAAGAPGGPAPDVRGQSPASR